MRYHLHVEYCFHAVGQGLFASGELEDVAGSDIRLRWVYDCGTTSSQSLVKKAIIYESMARRRLGRIDVMALSHFDADHISGVIELLGSNEVDILLIPYLPLVQRRALAETEGIGRSHPLHKLFENPAHFIAEIEGAKVRRLVLVPGGASGPPPDDEPPDFGEGGPTLDIEPGEPDPEDARDFEEISQAGRVSGIEVHLLRVGGRVRLKGIWEFMPYNDAEFAPQATPAFRAAAINRATRMLAGLGARDQELKQLCRLYDRAFGTGSRARNIISLFLYAGPLRMRYAHSHLEVGRSPKRPKGGIGFSHPGLNHNRGAPPGRFGILYTGDGYLDTKARLKTLMTQLGPRRKADLSCVQVMHHGSQKNWSPGVAATFSPDWSVFSSDPGHLRFRHPHEPVVVDFAGFGPIQVDRKHHAVIRACVDIG